ncbi:MAG: TfuA-related McrA-glycine thioamidation protein [Methanomassiliicoccales archaeon]
MFESVVFIGPSLKREMAMKLLGTETNILPPVKRGDLPNLDSNVKLIGIIDGVFFEEAAVGHREIVDKIRAGVKIFGGSSMGALRAYELKSFGMIGIGKIYQMYVQRELEGDDEVALIFDPETYEPLSEPLVNLRYNLELAVEKNILNWSQKNKIIEKLKDVYYPKRNKETMFQYAKKILDEKTVHRLKTMFNQNYVDLKEKDAIDVINALKSVRKNVNNNHRRYNK